MWNLTEKQVVEMLNNMNKNPNYKQFEKYALSSRPKIGWNGQKILNHFELLTLIYQNEFGISKKNFVNLVNDEKLKQYIYVIEKDFNGLFSPKRKELILKMLEFRFKKINDSFT